MDNIAGDFFGTYYRTATDMDQVTAELATDVDTHWETKYQASVTRDGDDLVELSLATCNMQAVFYAQDSSVRAHVTPVVRGRSQAASYAAFEESDYALERYLHRYFDPLPATPGDGLDGTSQCYGME